VEPAQQPRLPTPVSGEVRLEDRGRAAPRAHTDPAGGHLVEAPAGDDTLVVAVGGPFPSCPTAPVTVQAAATSTIGIDCDTDIR
jgi:hypothetical protein